MQIKAFCDVGIIVLGSLRDSSFFENFLNLNIPVVYCLWYSLLVFFL